MKVRAGGFISRCPQVGRGFTGGGTQRDMAEMTSTAVIELLHLFESAGVEVWLDGGWGVDALLEVQTRPHKDVDIVVRLSDAPRLCAVLSSRAFSVRPGGTRSSFVLENLSGLEVDVHAVTFDESGNGVYRMQNGIDLIYPAAGFVSKGSISGVPVRCLSTEAQVLGHAEGYLPTAKDVSDMENLRSRFGVELPPHLRRSKCSQN